MYSYEDRMRAVELYIKYDFSAADVVRELGYPKAKKSLKYWYRDYLTEQQTGMKHDRYKSYARYPVRKMQEAVDYYLEHGKSLSRTVKKMGYPSRPTLMAWIDELAPGLRKLHTYTKNNVKYSFEQKKEAVLGLCARDKESAESIADEVGITRCVLYKWKYDLLGKESGVPADKRSAELPEDIDELKAMAKSLQDDIARLELEKEILEMTTELIKKDPSANPTALTNKEKTIVIGALRPKHPLKALLKTLDMSKSSYYYQVDALAAPDKHSEARGLIIELFYENEGKYGYRPIHQLLRQKEVVVSEKVVRSIMTEEHLAVRRKKNKKYSSYAGEVTPAPDNIIARDFHAGRPNEKWLTDLTEFHIPAGKVYLSPVIDCFDGMAVSWSIGTSPNAELANSMLRGAIGTLHEDERPLVHYDRGCHYRWPGWIELMKANGLVRSMSKKGCSPDNSACEGFFGRLKLEFFYGRDWRGVTIEEFIEKLDQHIRWYNELMIKKSLGWMSPVKYRKSLGLVA